MSQKRRVFANLSAFTSKEDKDPRLCTLREGTRVRLSIEDSHHITHVLRMKCGDEILLHDRGCVLSPSKAKISEIADTVELTVAGVLDIEDSFSPVGGLVFALSKGDRNDFVCQKATELGVPMLLFWQAERSVVRVESDSARQHKLERWRKIAESAARQSGQIKLPEIKLLVGNKELFEFLNSFIEPDDKAIYCSLSENSRPLHDIIVDHSQLHLIIGPEGDLSHAEEISFAEAGFLPATLGSSVLRSETAAIVAVAMAQALWRAI